MQELSVFEVEQVSGSGLFSAIGYYLGVAVGAGAAMMKGVDGSGNEMMSAMQYGA